MNKNIEDYKQLLIELHSCISLGLDESDKAEAIRDKMDKIKSTKEEIKLMQQFSEDLYKK